MTTSTFPRRDGDAVPAFVLHLAQGLQDLDVEVTVLAPSDADGAEGQVGGVPVVRYRYGWPRRTEVLFNRGGMAAALAERRTIAPLVGAAIAAQAAAVRRLVGRDHHDLVHAHWLVPQGLAAATARVGVPVVMSAHGGDVFSFVSGPATRLKASVARRAAIVTANGPLAASAIVDLTDGDVRPEVILTGARVASPDSTAVAAWQDRLGHGDPVLAFAGRLVEEKGVLDLLEAAAHLPQLRVAIAGDGPLAAAIDERAAGLGIADRVSRHGWVTDVPAFFAAADVVVLPSKRSSSGWVEAQGLAMVEAMASGTPLVTTRSGGIPDVVEDGVSGLLVPEGDPTAIADAVMRLFDDAALAERLAAGGRLRAEAFSVEGWAAATAALYERLLA